jgi:FlaA1/EpsC-like NDP-sugar epimerase
MSRGGDEMTRVLITGFAGSVGNVFTDHLCTKWPDIWVYGLDNNEWAVAASPDHVCLNKILADFDQAEKLPEFGRIDILIHCAAYKHVNLGETNPSEFVRNNIERTSKLFQAAYSQGIKILFISTDKAVEPISTYGMTKALGEHLAWHFGGIVARCGNFLHSTGSVIPIWERQIAESRPITLTNPAMTRYVSELDKAIAEIWQAFYARQGRSFVPGQRLIIPSVREVGLLELLDEVLQRHGIAGHNNYKPGLKIIGMRPGEKIHEKLYWDSEIDANLEVKTKEINKMRGNVGAKS